MKRTNLLLGASAFILSMAGAFVTKAAHINHSLAVFTGNSTNCNAYSARQSLTKTVRSGHTFKTAGQTAFTSNSCSHKLYTVGD